MANNVTVKDASASNTVFKTTDNAGVHTPHHIVDSSALPTGAATSAKQDTVIGHLDGVETLLGTIDGDTQNLAGTVFADGASWTDDSSLHLLVGGVYQATPHTVTDNDTTPLLTDANGRLVTVDQNSAAALSALQTIDNAISGNEMQVDVVAALPAGTNNIGDVDIASIAAGDNNIGNVDIASIAAGDNNIGNVDVVTLPDVRQSWRVETQSFTTADDSDATFTVDANEEWQILSIYVSLATTATAGDRQLAIHYTDSSDNVIGRLLAGIVQAASLTRTYQWGPGLPQEVAFRDTDYIAGAMYPMFLTAGQKIRIFDNNAVAAAADDMTIRMQIATRSIA